MARMNNETIIANAKAANGIDEECHTYAHWKTLGYQVRKGSKAMFKASIWKYVAKGKADDDSDEEQGRMFMKTAAFFGASQVEAIA